MIAEITIFVVFALIAVGLALVARGLGGERHW